MTSVKDQYKLLKDIGRGVTEGVKKVTEPFVKEALDKSKEAVFIPGAVKGAKKIVDTVKSKIKKGDK